MWGLFFERAFSAAMHTFPLFFFQGSDDELETAYFRRAGDDGDNVEIACEAFLCLDQRRPSLETFQVRIARRVFKQ